MAGPGPLDYADYQRISNLDGDTLINVSGTFGGGTKEFGIFNVSRYAGLQLYSFRQAAEHGDATLTFTWYSTKAAAEEKSAFTMGRRSFTRAGEIIIPMQALIPNLGPWLTVSSTCESLSAALKLFASNRVSPLLFTPEVPLIVANYKVKAAVAEQKIVYPLGYYAGPAHLLFHSAAEAGSIFLDTLTSNGNWAISTLAGSVGKLGNVDSIIMCPSSAWRVKVENTGAAEAEYWVVIMPSATGAA